MNTIFRVPSLPTAIRLVRVGLRIAAITLRSLPLASCKSPPARLDAYGRPFEKANAYTQLPFLSCRATLDPQRHPTLVVGTKPYYPPGTHALGFEGDVTVDFTVEAKGTLVIDRSSSSGSDELRQNVLKAMSDWQFEPARAGGVPATSLCSTTFAFKRGSAQGSASE